MRRSPIALLLSVAAMLSLSSAGLRIARAESAGEPSAAATAEPNRAEAVGCEINTDQSLTNEEELQSVLRRIRETEADPGEAEDMVILTNGNSQSYDAPLSVEHILQELREQMEGR